MGGEERTQIKTVTVKLGTGSGDITGDYERETVR